MQALQLPALFVFIRIELTSYLQLKTKLFIANIILCIICSQYEQPVIESLIYDKCQYHFITSASLLLSSRIAISVTLPRIMTLITR